jgi:protein-S-isoprenylcysteine O-methyltransferase Ste14
LLCGCLAPATASSSLHYLCVLNQRLILLSWAVFCGYWAWGSLFAKAGVGRSRRYRWYLPTRFIVPALALGYVALMARSFRMHPMVDSIAGVFGAAICLAGVGLAVWARVCMGDNWGMPMTQRETPELVTSGPFARLRHPIYAGVLLAILGTLLALDPKALFGWLIAVAYFAISAIKEERDLLKIFPAQYRAYMQHTSRLIPFVW